MHLYHIFIGLRIHSIMFSTHIFFSLSGWIKKCWLFSLELDYHFNPSRNRAAISSQNLLLAADPGNFIFEQTRRHDFGLGVRVGQIITPQFALYGIVNLRFSQFDYKFFSEKTNAIGGAAQINSAHNNKKFRWGSGFGIGFRYALPKGFSVGPEITYNFYQPLKTNQNLAVQESQFYVKSCSQRILNISFKLSKTF